MKFLLTGEHLRTYNKLNKYKGQYAVSAAYTIFHGPDRRFEEYLISAVEKSDISTAVEPDPESHYVLMSTCANGDYLARTVVHARLVPLDSAGGKLILNEEQTE